MIYICIYLVRFFFLFLASFVGFSFVPNSSPFFHSFINIFLKIIVQYRLFACFFTLPYLLSFFRSKLKKKNQQNKTKQYNCKSISLGVKISTIIQLFMPFISTHIFMGNTSVQSNLLSQVKYFKWLFVSLCSFFLLTFSLPLC